MLGLVIALLVLIALTGLYVALPVLRPEDAPEPARGTEAGLEGQARAEVEREIRWRLDHDREAGRLSEEEFQHELSRLEGGEAESSGER